MQLSMFSAEERPANHSASLDSERDWTIHVATSCSPILRLLSGIAPCPAIRDGILAPSSEGWQNSGMGSPTEFWTLNTPAWHSGADVCLLSAVLETGDVPQRYYLSARACRGILRRADKRGKSLPQTLRRALKQVAAEFLAPETVEDKILS